MSEFADFNIEDLQPPSPATREHFVSSVNGLPWELVPISQSAQTWYENEALQIGAGLTVHRRSPYIGAENIPIIPDADIGFTLKYGDEAVVMYSDRPDLDKPSHKGLLQKLIEFVDEEPDDENAHWLREGCKQLALVKEYPELPINLAAADLLSMRQPLSEGQLIQHRFRNGASVLATRGIISSWTLTPVLSKGHPSHEFRSVTLTFADRKYHYSDEKRETATIQDIVDRSPTEDSYTTVQRIWAESRFDRENGLDVVTEGKMRTLTAMISAAVESGLAA